MSKINVLAKQLADIIAAGEVVERPAAVIKELVENSIDAGATSIMVEIRDGGISYMRVSDNGCGIASDEVQTAFLRHATSKIITENDLDNINTLGFRGEALASVCAVSKVTMLTREVTATNGVKCVIHGSEIIEFEESGAPLGTTITVRELFYNTPARMKFMKKNTYEANAVQAIVERIALSSPAIKFKFIRDNNQVILTAGDNNLQSTISSVLGREFAGQLLKVSYDYNALVVQGYISKPINARANRNMQYFFINGRYVKSKTATAAIQEAYKNSIAIGKFPSCVLYININPSLIDVNVHPAKIEVRFVNEKDLFDAVYYAVKSSLNEKDLINELNINKPTPPVTHHKAPDAVQKSLYITAQAPNIKSDKREDTVTLNQTGLAYNEIKINPVENAFKLNNLLTTVNVDEIKTGNINAQEQLPINIQNTQDINDKIEIAEVKAQLNINVLGEIFTTYVVVTINEDLLLVDKHAAHERLTFNKLKNDRQIAKQYLLEPITLTLTADEQLVVLENIDLLNQYGFEIEDFGKNSIIVRAVPTALPYQNTALLIQDIAYKLLSGAKNAMPDNLDWLYNSIACRSSVKAGKFTTVQELTALINEAFVYEDIRYCPHGRPIAFKISRSEIEKFFLRG